MNLVVLPLLTPLATALLCAATSTRPRLQRWLSLAGALFLLGSTLTLLRRVALQGNVSMAAGGWPLPFGIELVADRLGIALVLIAALMLVIVLFWQESEADPATPSPMLHPLLHGLVAGAVGAFLTADLFNLYVWFEVALIASLGLLAQGGALRQLDAALKYFALNLVGTLLLLAAIAMLYAVTGHLNFTALGQAAGQVDAAILLPLLGLLMIAFLIKVAAFPFFAWLPASYHTLPAPVLALFSALLSKIGLCALLKSLGGYLPPAPTPLFELLGWLALLSMVTGVLGAAYHWDMRRILAFHSISQVGYMLLALALTTRTGNAAAIFFALHHSLVKAGLFLTAALIFHQAGHYDLRRIGGLSTARPLLAGTFLLLALSLVGIPPSSGFWGKYLIIRECLREGEYLWATAALAVGSVTFYSMLKIWMEAFWKPHPEANRQNRSGKHLLPAYAGLGLLAMVILWMGLYPEPLMAFVTEAAAALGGGIQ